MILGSVSRFQVLNDTQRAVVANLCLIGRAKGQPFSDPRPENVRADKAYASKAARARIVPTLPAKRDIIASRKRKASKGGRPLGFGELFDQGRNVVKCQFYDRKQWRGAATRYGKLATAYQTDVMATATSSA